MPESMMQPDLQDVGATACRRRHWHVGGNVGGWGKKEAWRFTRLAALDKLSLRWLMQIGNGAGKLPAHTLPAGARVIHFHNGMLVAKSLNNLPKGVSARLVDEDDLSAIVDLAPANHPVTDLSVAAMTSGLSLDVAAGAKVTAPIILMFTGNSGSVSTHPVVLMRVVKGAQAVIAEWHHTGVGLSAPLMAIDIGDNARLDYAKIQQDSATTMHLAATGIKMGEAAVLDGFQLSIGGCLARLETHVMLSAETADCRLSAIYLGRSNQHHDITTNMTHACGHCQSNQVIRGVLDEAARGVFQGKVHVAQDAQKTDGQQMSRALLLSRKAEADASQSLKFMQMMSFARMVQPLVSLMKTSFSILPVVVYHAKWRVPC